MEAAKRPTLEEAFTLLKVNLDPPLDVYRKTRQYYDMHWNCGEQVDDFFIRMWKTAKDSRHTAKQACNNMVSQLPDKIELAART